MDITDDDDTNNKVDIQFFYVRSCILPILRSANDKSLERGRRPPKTNILKLSHIMGKTCSLKMLICKISMRYDDISLSQFFGGSVSPLKPP